MLDRETLVVFKNNCLKKNQNAPRPSEHPQSGGGNVKRLGGIIDLLIRTFSVLSLQLKKLR